MLLGQAQRRAGPTESGLRVWAGEKEKERPAGKEGLGWVFPWAGLFWVWASSRVWAPFLFLFSLSFLFLIQTKFEFKYKFEF